MGLLVFVYGIKLPSKDAKQSKCPCLLIPKRYLLSCCIFFNTFNLLYLQQEKLP